MNKDKVFIIAEAGVNHNGSLAIAKKLIDSAVMAGADAVKFQTFKTEEFVSKTAPKANYQIKNTGQPHEAQFEMIKKLELDNKSHKELMKYCYHKKVIFLSSAFDLGSINQLVKLGLPIFKIPSGEINNLPYLIKIGKLNKQIILSTGMSTLADIEGALELLIKAGTSRDNITLLHCNTDYPTPMDDVNLKAIATLKEAFKVSVGYSDHTLGIEVPIAAVAMGAEVIEKHFTLNKNMEGPDHLISLEPNELKEMIKAIRNIELALGDGIKKPTQSETKNKPLVRKSIVAKTFIKKGEIFNKKNLAIKRPGNGISPMLWNAVIGQAAKKDYAEDELI